MSKEKEDQKIKEKKRNALQFTIIGMRASLVGIDEDCLTGSEKANLHFIKINLEQLSKSLNK